MSLILSGSDGVSDIDGTVSTPAIRGTDANTGIFFPAADTIAFAEGGVESMRIDSSGNLLVGTATTGSTGIGLVDSYNLGWVQSSGQSIPNLFRQQSSAATVLANGYRYSATTNGFASSFSSSWAKAAIAVQDGTVRFYTDTAAAVAAGTDVTPTERMRIDSSGNVGIGTSSPARNLSVYGTNATIAVQNSTTGATSSDGMLIQQAGNDSYLWNLENSFFSFGTNNSERMRIDSSGNVFVAKTASTITTVGCELLAVGAALLTRDSNVSLIINRLTNDGGLVSFRQDSTEEGTISVSGSTVSYNGGHLSRWSQLPNNSKDDTILKGTVMSNLDDMCVWTKDGETLPNEQLNKMKVSDVEGDTNVAGVFVNWTRDEDCNSDDMNIAMTGDMIIRIADGVVVQKGDLLMSAGDGTAKPQGDDIRRSKTVAKVTSNHVTCTYADGSYCVPCVLMAC